MAWRWRDSLENLKFGTDLGESWTGKPQEIVGDFEWGSSGEGRGNSRQTLFEIRSGRTQSLIIDENFAIPIGKVSIHASTQGRQIQAHSKLFWAIRAYSGLYKAIWAYSNLFGTIRYFSGLLEAIQSHSGLFGLIWDYSKLLVASWTNSSVLAGACWGPGAGKGSLGLSGNGRGWLQWTGGILPSSNSIAKFFIEHAALCRQALVRA